MAAAVALAVGIVIVGTIRAADGADTVLKGMGTGIRAPLAAVIVGVINDTITRTHIVAVILLCRQGQIISVFTTFLHGIIEVNAFCFLRQHYPEYIVSHRFHRNPIIIINCNTLAPASGNHIDLPHIADGTEAIFVKLMFRACIPAGTAFAIPVSSMLAFLTAVVAFAIPIKRMIAFFAAFGTDTVFPAMAALGSALGTLAILPAMLTGIPCPLAVIFIGAPTVITY